jgi:hypothetical protein
MTKQLHMLHDLKAKVAAGGAAHTKPSRGDEQRIQALESEKKQLSSKLKDVQENLRSYIGDVSEFMLEQESTNVLGGLLMPPEGASENQTAGLLAGGTGEH